MEARRLGLGIEQDVTVQLDLVDICDARGRPPGSIAGTSGPAAVVLAAPRKHRVDGGDFVHLLTLRPATTGEAAVAQRSPG